MLLYHGSKAGIEGSIRPISRDRCDFGRGFYMGTNRDQPLTLICNYPSAVFYTLEVDLYALRVLTHALDDTYDRLQWAGEEYILEELDDEAGGLARAGETWPLEAMYWLGYVYRYWHYLTGESSAQIVKRAPGELMLACHPGYHTLDVQMAIERLLEAGDSRQQAAITWPKGPSPHGQADEVTIPKSACHML